MTDKAYYIGDGQVNNTRLMEVTDTLNCMHNSPSVMNGGV